MILATSHIQTSINKSWCWQSMTLVTYLTTQIGIVQILKHWCFFFFLHLISTNDNFWTYHIELTQFPRTTKSHGQYHELRSSDDIQGGTHIFGRTGMCRSNGLFFYKKSLNMGPVFYQKKSLNMGQLFWMSTKFYNFWGFCHAKTPKIAKFLKNRPRMALFFTKNP